MSLVAVALFSATVDATVYSTGAAGRTKGSFAVSPTGAATYTIPIWSPPGPHGLTPNIALTYNSQQGNGYLGVGWSISGLSAIARCNLTYAQDAAAGPVALATSDGYCMDGQRLRLTGGTYGETGSTYQTEVANFVNVTAYGSAGNGPAYWIAQDRNGRSYTYGDGGSSQVPANGSSTALAWMLNEVSDPYGNTMTVAYSVATGTAVPTTISWTPSSHGSSTYNYTMTFAYGTNAAPPQGYVGGTSFKNTNLLSSIAIAYSGTAVKTYYLTYQVSSTTGRDRLTQVQECAGSGTSNCLSPTAITYQNGSEGVTTSATTAIPSGSQTLLYVDHDFNGDGYRDLVYCNGGTPDIIYVAFGSATGYGTPVDTGINCNQASYGDLQGTGKDGILAPNGSTWYYYTWNGSSFSGVSTGLAYDSTAAQYLLADINGDGLPDLISTYFSCTTNSEGTECALNVYARLNTTTAGGAPRFASSTTLAYQLPDSYTLVGAELQSEQQYGPGKGFDFNGDGRQDLSLEKINGKYPNYTISTWELISTGTTFAATQIASTTAATYVPVLFLDFNSDACTDYLVSGTIYVSGCNGTVPTTVSLGSANVIAAMDWDGDGLTDILVQNGSTVGVYKSTGVGLSGLISTSIPYSSNNVYLSFDANGDGLDDLGVWVGAAGTGSTSVNYYLHNDAGQPPDLLTSVTDAFGNSASSSYVSLVQNNYTGTGSWCTTSYPDQVDFVPMYAVSQATFSDPSSASGGTYSQTFWYYCATTNLEGRGFEGFYATRAYDSRNSLYHFQFYLTSFPYTGMKAEDWVSPNETASISEDLGQKADIELSSTQYQERYLTYFSNWTSQRWEVGGSENGDLITTTSTTYTLDDYGNPTSIARVVTDQDPDSPYTGQTWTTTITNTPDESTNPWCLSLLSQSQIAYSASGGGASVTIAKTFTPDTTHCDYTQVVTQSNSGSSYAVTEAFAYDTFGNVNSDTVTGAGMTARKTTANWGTTGQFVNTRTDPTNATTTWTYSSTQSLGFGVPDSVEDANNLTTSWVYDGFGRKAKETRPDGTYTTAAYTNCSGTTGCLLGAAGGIDLTIDVYGNNASLITQAESYYDSIDRLLVATKIMMGGSSWSRVDTRYDSLGRIAERSFPCVYSSLTTTCTYWTTNTYDVLNRLTQSQRPISSTNSNLQTTSYAYAGRTTTLTDALSNSWTTIKDVNGWLRRTTDPYSYYVTLAYDAAGNKTAVTDSGSNSLWSATYNYGIGAFPASITDIDMGTWTFTDDALGEKTGWKDAKSQSFSETYDALSRPLTRSEPDYFTQWTWGSSASSHNIGKLQSVCTGTGSSPTNCTGNPGYAEGETYDSDGRLSQRTITLPGANGTFTYTWAYNATTGLLNTLTYPASYPSSYSLQLQYAYAYGYLQSITDVSDTPNVAVWTNDAMNPAGQITEETLGNGIETNRNYDAVTGWLGADQSGVSGGSGVKNLSFLYDQMGNVTQRQDNNLGLTENAYYDDDYRLTSTTLNGTQNLAVTYDNTMGNIVSRSDVAGGATWTYSPTQKHAVTQAGSSAYAYTYDANGNATARQGNSITWSSYNYPVTVNAGSGSSAETVAFSYGPDRMRWQQMYNGNGTNETTNYVGGLLEVVSGTTYRHYIYAGGEPVAVYARSSAGNTFSYVLSDHQGSVSDLTNSSGASVVNESFTPFGQRRNPTTWSGAASNSDLTTAAGITRQAYTFQTQLGLWMGMNHMNGRVQDAVTGRMLSADPNIPDPTNPQDYNRYSYVDNSPLTHTDPSGFADSQYLPIDPTTPPGVTITVYGSPREAWWVPTSPVRPGPDWAPEYLR